MTDIEKLTPCCKWTDDCQGKKDYDGRLISISTRYWPSGGGFHILRDGDFKLSTDPEILPSAHASIHLNHGEPDDDGHGDYAVLAEKEFEATTQEEVQRQVETWVLQQFRDIAALLAARYEEGRHER